MADKLMRATVTIPLDNGVPEDSCVNVFHFDGDDDPLAGAEDYHGWVMQMLTTFYQTIDGVIFPRTIASPATVKIYDLRDPEPRVPEHIGTIALTPADQTGLPNEMAICLSFQATAVSGLSQKRRRGRVYLGPLAAWAEVMSEIASQPRVIASCRNTIAAAAGVMQEGIAHPASPGFRTRWAIYSPRTDVASSIDDAFNDVDNGWVDDAFDVQRRRGASPTARSLFS